jgi:hypothetical protein
MGQLALAGQLARETGQLALAGAPDDDSWKVSAASLATNVGGGGIHSVAGAYTTQPCFVTFHKRLPASASSMDTSQLLHVMCTSLVTRRM